MSEQKPSICRMVVYNHPGSADGKYPPMKSPAIIQSTHTTAVSPSNPREGSQIVCDLFVMSSNGIFFAECIPEGDGPSTWEWPKRV